MYKYKDVLYERIYVNVDSRQRSVNKYPESNSFRLNNSDKYTNVIYAKLLTAETPNTDYNVNEFNNHIIKMPTNLGKDFYNILLRIETSKP